MHDAPAWVTALPTVNAVLNSTSALLLIAGYRFIRARRIDAHRACMIGALSTSALFLVSYLTLHYHIGATPFPHQGAIRTFYFAVLVSHSILAAAVAPMAIVTVVLALRGTFGRHARLARWTLPIWLYVSVTGVIVYWMLYRLPAP